MNRQHRRKVEREEAKRRRYLDPETRTAARGLNHHFAVPQFLASLPPKVPGRHRWILSSAYNVTPEEAAIASEGVEKVLMGPERLVSFGIGCWDCETLYDLAVSQDCSPPGRLRTE